MWLQNPKASGIRKGGGGGGNGLVAVAIDKDKGSQYALKWAVDSLLSRGQTIILIHVSHPTSSVSSKFVFSSYSYPIKWSYSLLRLIIIRTLVNYDWLSDGTQLLSCPINSTSICRLISLLDNKCFFQYLLKLK